MAKCHHWLSLLIAALFIAPSSAAENAGRELDRAKGAYEDAARKAKEELVKEYDRAIAERVRKGDRKSAQRLLERKKEFLKSIDPDYLPKERELLRMGPQALDAFVGRYPLADNRVVVVSREGNQLFVRGPTLLRTEILPVAEDKFVRADKDVLYTFYRDLEGKVNEVVRHGLPDKGRRIDEREVEIIQIKALIDGRSRLLLKGNTLQWLHLDHAAPGRHEQQNLPTLVNGVRWYPTWPDLPEAENRFGCCRSGIFREVKPALPVGSSEIGIGIVRGRSPVWIIDRPHPDNDFTLTVEIDDNEEGGSHNYVIEIYRRKSTRRPPEPGRREPIGKVPADGLALHLPFNGDAKDESGNGRHGDVHGAVPAQDRFGRPEKAYFFAEGAYIRVPPVPRKPNAPLSVSVWARYEGVGLHQGWNNVIISQEGEATRIWQLSTLEDRITWHRMEEGPDVGRARRVVPNTWYHVVVVFDGERHSLYLDGVLLDWRGGGLDANNEVPINLGRRDHRAGPLPFTGMIDDVRLYDRALTRPEVKALYHEGVYDRAPLVGAAKRGQLAIVRQLVAGKVEVDATDKDGVTPLFWAADRGHTEVVKLLLDRGANVALTAPQGLTPLHAAARGGHSGMVKLLIDKRAHVDARALAERTPLHDAAAHGRLECAKLLLDHGADVEAADALGDTALHRAAMYGHIEVAKLLLDAGADAEVRNVRDKSPSALALAMNWPDFVEQLQRHLKKLEAARRKEKQI